MASTDARMFDASEIRHERIRADGLDLHVAIGGDGTPVILLHGFPETWRSWRHQFAALTLRGFSLWAPDMRGYNLSDRPAARDAYHLRHLIADLAALVKATGRPRAHVGGHDWGGIVAWTFASHHPDLVDKLMIFNAPHPRIYLQKVRRVPQMLKAWYVLFFLVPRLPEWTLSAGNFRAVRRMFGHYPARTGAFNEEDIDEYVRALSLPGALTAELNYYRANVRSSAIELAASGTIAAETLVIWGERDPALGTELLDGLEQIAPRVRIHRLPEVGHWVQNEAPEEINRVLIEFLTSGSGQPVQTT